MDLSRYFGPEQILLHLKPKDKWKLLDQMINALLKSDVCQRQNEDVRQKIGPLICERERQYVTGIGKGYAFPHARVPDFTGLAVCLAILDEPIEYGSPDGQGVRIACMVVTPEENPTIGVKALGVLASLLNNETVKNYFLSETSPQKIYNYIREKKLNLDISITAQDIMRAPLFEIHPDTPLRQVVHTMVVYRVEAVGVTDGQGHVLGEISCNTLFNRGLPDFFSSLASVSFVKHFDPFEKYFAGEAKASAGEVMTGNFATVNEDATLLEIIFLLTVRNHPKVYVLREGRRVGIIDRTCVLDRILSL